MCESVGEADLLSDHFESKQSREPADSRSLAIRLLLSYTTFVFGSS